MTNIYSPNRLKIMAWHGKFGIVHMTGIGMWHKSRVSAREPEILCRSFPKSAHQEKGAQIITRVTFRNTNAGFDKGELKREQHNSMEISNVVQRKKTSWRHGKVEPAIPCKVSYLRKITSYTNKVFQIE